MRHPFRSIGYGLILLYTWGLFSCREKNDISDLVQKNEKGIEENKVDVLTVDDVAKLQNAEAVPSLSYTAVIMSSMQKEYPFEADSGQTVQCLIRSDKANAKVMLYKMMDKMIQTDTFTQMKIKDYVWIGEGDSVKDISRKAAKYKAVVKLKAGSDGDSTMHYTLQVFKK